MQFDVTLHVHVEAKTRQEAAAQAAAAVAAEDIRVYGYPSAVPCYHQPDGDPDTSGPVAAAA